jgi:hypothetical protein
MGKYFLVDTGATISILPLALWQDISTDDKTEIQQTSMRIRAGNDSNCDVRGTSQVRFSIADKEYVQDFYICSDATAAILGMDFQAKYDMYLRPAKNQLFIEGNIEIPCFEAPTFNAKSRVHLFESYLLAPNEEAILQGKVQADAHTDNKTVCS